MAIRDNTCIDVLYFKVCGIVVAKKASTHVSMPKNSQLFYDIYMYNYNFPR